MIEWQPRAIIFYEKYGYWDNVEYMLWISDKVKEYTGSIYGAIKDQDAFTEFLRYN